ncbi:hypothetical protein [Aquibacillus salsiterrae]|uniref:Uncharacterized protein n=1 Tax=Aquibacillus salsiterrae TaxID=2950439 RepID=A0A9X3WF23_9BACI|nr:hypothetical protein [Aquibacillus salsiterrae]MDC3418632.1 hypothetical protein [Aquibacillus salsiterrae]
MFLPLHVYGWTFFVISESLTWLFVILFMLARYKWMANRLSYLFMIGAIICNLFQLVIVWVDYYFTGTVSFLQMVIILFIIYATTLGSNDMKRIDSYIQKKINNKRNSRITSSKVRMDNKTYILYKRNLFLLHTVAYFLFHLLWYIFDPNTTGLPNYSLFFFNEWINYPHEGFYSLPIFNIISYFWKIIYFFECIVMIFYSSWLIFDKQHHR